MNGSSSGTVEKTLGIWYRSWFVVRYGPTIWTKNVTGISICRVIITVFIMVSQTDIKSVKARKYTLMTARIINVASTVYITAPTVHS